jgi:hypothetical protein
LCFVLPVVERSAVVRVDAESDLDAAVVATWIAPFDDERFDENVVGNAVAHVRGGEHFFFVELVIAVLVDAALNPLPALGAVLSRRFVERRGERIVARLSLCARLSVVGARDHQETEAREQRECRTHLRKVHPSSSFVLHAFYHRAKNSPHFERLRPAFRATLEGHGG